MKTKNPQLVDRQGWNEYWAQKKKHGGIVYDLIAEFYRKFLIKPLLDHFVKKYFAKGANILHAGCGSGQVDRNIRHHVSITGLDISPNALKIYGQENGDYSKSILGSIFAIPIPNESVDGIYNLGVMEHFSEEEISEILQEFKRVLKPSGRMVIFWPPEFGLSVMFFKTLKVILRRLTGKDFKFHPDEVCRVKSRKHVFGIFEREGLTVLEHYFGPKDIFTYYVIVAEKLAPQ